MTPEDRRERNHSSLRQVYNPVLYSKRKMKRQALPVNEHFINTNLNPDRNKGRFNVQTAYRGRYFKITVSDSSRCAPVLREQRAWLSKENEKKRAGAGGPL